MSKTFVANGTGSGQTLSELDSDKIPVYSTEADLDTDLANLEDGELALYPSEGAEMSLPVDTVQSGNLHAVTSNAVAGMFGNWTFEGQGISNDLTTETVGFSTLGKRFILIVFRTGTTGGDQYENLGSVLLPISVLSNEMFAQGYITYAIGDIYFRYRVLSTANDRLSLNFTTSRAASVGAVFSA